MTAAHQEFADEIVAKVPGAGVPSPPMAPTRLHFKSSDLESEFIVGLEQTDPGITEALKCFQWVDGRLEFRSNVGAIEADEIPGLHDRISRLLEGTKVLGQLRTKFEKCLVALDLAASEV